MKDLICLVADKNMEAGVSALIRRHAALGIRRITADVIVHPRRDPGVFREGVQFLRQAAGKYRRGLLLLDAAWAGAPSDIQQQLDRMLADASLQNWARAIVVKPELEAWVWSDSPQVDAAIGWQGRKLNVRQWLQLQGLWHQNDPKPRDPKTALQRALWEVRKPQSSSIYRRLARTVSVKRCRDPAFLQLRRALQQWFPQT
jgi:hypothetical protein